MDDVGRGEVVQATDLVLQAGYHGIGNVVLVHYLLLGRLDAEVEPDREEEDLPEKLPRAAADDQVRTELDRLGHVLLYVLLYGQLVLGIRKPRRRLRRHGLVHVLAGTVDGDTAHVDELAHAGCAGGVHNVRTAIHVDVAHLGLSELFLGDDETQVDDGIMPSHHVLQLGIPHVELHMLVLVVSEGRGLPVDAGDRFNKCLRGQQGEQRGGDTAGGASDKNFHKDSENGWVVGRSRNPLCRPKLLDHRKQGSGVKWLLKCSIQQSAIQGTGKDRWFVV